MQQLCTTRLFAHSPPSRMGERIGRVKVRKLMSWQKDSHAWKQSHTFKERKIRDSSSTSNWQAGVLPSPGKEGSLTCNGYLGRQTSSLRMPPPSFFFCLLHMLSMMSYVRNILLVSWGQLSQLCPRPNFLRILSLLFGGVMWETEQALNLCKYCSTTKKTSLCYQRCFQQESKT